MNKKPALNQQQMQKLNIVRIFLYALIAVLIFNIFFPKQKKDDVAVIKNQQEEITIKSRIPVFFENNNIKAEINTVGLQLDSLELKNYKDKADLSKNVKVFSPAFIDDKPTDENQVLTSGYKCMSKDLDCPTSTTKWTQVPVKNGNTMKFTWTNKQGILFTKLFEFNPDYTISIDTEIKNNSNRVLTFYPYIAISKTVNLDKSSGVDFKGVVLRKDGLKKQSFKDISKDKNSQNFSLTDSSSWIAYTDNYFATILLLNQGAQDFTKNTVGFKFVKETVVNEEKISKSQIDTAYPTKDIVEGAEFVWTDKVFAGPKDLNNLKQVAKSYNISKLDTIIDYGFFAFLSKWFYVILAWLYSVLGSAGLAIIGFAVILKIVTHPLTAKSMKSMAAMKKLGPEMKKIQAYYGNDKKRMSMEMAALYKKHKVNPMSGCLPILIQIPIFLALYKVLLTNIDLRMAEFLWISDLSSADQTSLFNLFGLLPYNLPAWLPAIGILPLLMGVSMWLQQKIQASPSMNKGQAMMMKMMPLVLVIVFAGLPAGLILYYLVFNILTVIHQYFIFKNEAK